MSRYSILAKPMRIRVCEAGEVPVGEVRKAETDGLVLAVFNLDGEFHVTDDH